MYIMCNFYEIVIFNGKYYCGENKLRFLKTRAEMNCIDFLFFFILKKNRSIARYDLTIFILYIQINAMCFETEDFQNSSTERMTHTRCFCITIRQSFFWIMRYLGDKYKIKGRRVLREPYPHLLSHCLTPSEECNNKTT